MNQRRLVVVVVVVVVVARRKSSDSCCCAATGGSGGMVWARRPPRELGCARRKAAARDQTPIKPPTSADSELVEYPRPAMAVYWNSLLASRCRR
jgi:hypothetical protein